MNRLVRPSTVTAGGLRDRLAANGKDVPSLLDAWLNHLLFLFNVQHEIFCRFTVRTLTPTLIDAEGEGELFDPGRHARGEALTKVRVESVAQTVAGWSATLSL